MFLFACTVLLHGDADTTVPFESSWDFGRALCSLGEVGASVDTRDPVTQSQSPQVNVFLRRYFKMSYVPVCTHACVCVTLSHISNERVSYKRSYRLWWLCVSRHTDPILELPMSGNDQLGHDLVSIIHHGKCDHLFPMHDFTDAHIDKTALPSSSWRVDSKSDSSRKPRKAKPVSGLPAVRSLPSLAELSYTATGGHSAGINSNPPSPSLLPSGRVLPSAPSMHTFHLNDEVDYNEKPKKSSVVSSSFWSWLGFGSTTPLDSVKPASSSHQRDMDLEAGTLGAALPSPHVAVEPLCHPVLIACARFVNPF